MRNDEETYGNVSRVNFITDEGEEEEFRHCSHSHWASAAMETLVKLGNLEEPIIALIDNSSEINLISKK